MSQSDEDDFWQRPTGPQHIFDVDAMVPRPNKEIRRGRGGSRSGQGADGNTREQTENIYSRLGREVKMRTSDGRTGAATGYRSMGNENLPGDEQYRKESGVFRRNVMRDQRMREKKLVTIQDNSTDEFVIPCAYPGVLNVKKEKERELPPSTFRIEALLEMPSTRGRWCDAELDQERAESIEEVIVERAGRAAGGLHEEKWALSLSFEDYPPVFMKRDGRVLRTMVIDGCAVMKQANFMYEVPWNYTGGASEIFRPHKIVLVKPLVEMAMRCILQGHRTVIVLPNYYRNPVFAGLRQKVDDVAAFHSLVATGIVQFVEERNPEEMHQQLWEENRKLEGTWVSTSDLERIVRVKKHGEMIKKEEERRRRREEERMHERALREAVGLEESEAEEERVSSREEEKEKEVEMAVFSHRITPFFYDNKLILPLHMSRPDKTVMTWDELRHFEEGGEQRRESQLTLEEQMRILLQLQDIFELPIRTMRGMQMMRRIVKEIGESREEMSRLEGEMAIREFGEETRNAFMAPASDTITTASNSASTGRDNHDPSLI